MSVQDYVKRRILFKDSKYVYDDKKTDQEIYERVRKSMFTQYSWGIFCTAAARMDLQAGIRIAGKDKLVYVDTDSVKFVGDADFSAYNERRIKECMQSGLYATDKSGVTHYGGVYEFDGKYRRFRSHGAKKYAYEDENGELHITVSGVGKRAGAKELNEHGGLEAFEPGFVFHNSGKTESVYNDEKKPLITRIDGELVTITRNVVIRDTTYTLSITDDYADILNYSSNVINKVIKFWRNLQLQ